MELMSFPIFQTIIKHGAATIVDKGSNCQLKIRFGSGSATFGKTCVAFLGIFRHLLVNYWLHDSIKLVNSYVGTIIINILFG